MRTILRSLIHGFDPSVQGRAARQVEMNVRPMGGGRYGGRIDLKLPGQWELRVLADHPGGTNQVTRCVVLRPDG